VFLGAAGVGTARTDVAQEYGDGMLDSGFSLEVRGLPAGVYEVVAFAYSTVTNSFSQARNAVVTVAPDPWLIIDTPGAGLITVPTTITGWALDAASDGGTGVDMVHVWAFNEQGGDPQWVGAATYGLARPDVAAAFGKSAFTNSGFSLALQHLAPGRYHLAICARRTGKSEFDIIKLLPVEVRND